MKGYSAQDEESEFNWGTMMDTPGEFNRHWATGFG